MTSPLLSRSSSESCAFLLSSFSSSESPHTSLADLSPASASPNVLPSSNAPIFEQDPAISSLPSSAFLPSQASSTLEELPLDLIATIAAPAEQIVDIGSSSGNVMGACTDVGAVASSEELSILQEQQLSTPTMHPNLVSTLKSIICPLSDSLQSVAHLQGQDHVLDMVHDSAFCGAPVSNVGAPQLQMLFGCSNSASGAPIVLSEKGMRPTSEPKQPRHAAIVPIHLIQNRRPYRCTHTGCNKTFKNPQTLKMHHKTHCSNNDSNVCSKGKLLHSLATVPQSCKAGRNKKIPSRCPICKRAFVGLYELRRHFGRKHSEGEKAFACSKCGKRFYIEVDLRDHQKLCGEPLLCKCGMKFAFKCNLVAHKKAHPVCQEEQDQLAYQHCQDKQTGTAMPKNQAANAASMQSTCACPGLPKMFSLPNNGEHTYMMSPNAGAAMVTMSNHNAGCLYPLTSTHSHRPIVKSEQGTFNPWLASAVLGVSRAL